MGRGSPRRRKLIYPGVIALLLLSRAPKAQAQTPAALTARGDQLYYEGDQKGALADYDKAIKISSTTIEPWLNGAVLLEEMGEGERAIQWYLRAAPLTDDAEVLSALGWAQLRAGRITDARQSFLESLKRRKDDAETVLGQARAELALNRPAEALVLLDRAAVCDPLLTLVPFYKGKAYELLGDHVKEVEAYRQVIAADSYATEARDASGRVHLKLKNFNEAWKQFSKILDVEPRRKGLQALLQKLRPLLTRKTSDLRPRAARSAEPYLDGSQSQGIIPILRVGIGTNAMGKPTARQFLTFQVNGSFSIVDAKGKRWSQGTGSRTWQARIKSVKKKLYMELTGPGGKPQLLRREPLIIRPDARSKGLITLDDIQYAQGSNWTGISDKTLRGDLELSLYPSKRSLKLVNIVDLENYTNGVVSAEMPIRSPLEALKAQAVVARSHALFIKNVTRRHRKEGYDVCDEQHCQVYAGARAESPRSRAVVEGTRGRIVTYKGKVAHVIYSSNCGGHTQSGKDLAGWGDVPYWTGVADAPSGGPDASGPWQLRRWLTGMPASYCKPSTYVHPAHFRWTRVVPYNDVEEKFARKYKLGRLLLVLPGRRSVSGNINSLIVRGTKKQVKITEETAIRGLLGLGSLRSTMFIFNIEYGPSKKPESIVFHGGGWGHGVGLCQSGAMGRADAGQTYEEIIRGYFKGTELGQLAY